MLSPTIAVMTTQRPLCIIVCLLACACVCVHASLKTVPLAKKAAADAGGNMKRKAVPPAKVATTTPPPPVATPPPATVTAALESDDADTSTVFGSRELDPVVIDTLLVEPVLALPVEDAEVVVDDDTIMLAVLASDDVPAAEPLADIVDTPASTENATTEGEPAPSGDDDESL